MRFLHDTLLLLLIAKIADSKDRARKLGPKMQLNMYLLRLEFKFFIYFKIDYSYVVVSRVFVIVLFAHIL